MTDTDRLALESWLQARDPGAFKCIASRYAGLVYGTCLRILKNPTDAEDVAQESFAALALARDASKVRSLGGWLHRVATNLALRRVRSEARRRERDSRYVAQADSAVEVNHDDLMQFVDEAIAALPDHLRTPVVGYYLQDREQSAIAEELGVSRQLVTYRIAKGLEQIRKTLRRKGIVVSTAVLGATITDAAKAQTPATLLATLGKTALAGSVAAPAPHIAATVSAMGNTSIVTVLASKTTAVAAAVVVTICVTMAAICEHPPAPIADSSNAPVALPLAPEPTVAESAASGPAAEPQFDPVQKAYELRMAGRLDEAKALLRATTEDEPDNARAYFELARTAMHGLLPQAPVTDRKAAELKMTENLKLAGWAARKAVEADPRNAYFRYWEGLIATYSATGSVHSIWQLPSVPGRMSDSIHAFESALDLDPDYHEARYQVAGLYDRLPFYLGGNKKKSKAHYAELEARSPVWAARLTAERVVNDKAERIEKFQRDLARLKEVVKAHPDEPEAYEGLARECLSLCRAGIDVDANADAAFAAIENALALDGSRIDALRDYAYSAFSRKDYARAEAAINKLQALEPVAPIAAGALELLARIRDKQGRTAEAKQLHSQALATHPILDFPAIPAREFFSPPE